MALIRRVKKLVADKRGVTALEYGLIAAIMALAIIFGFGLLGNTLNKTMNGITTHMNVSG